MGDKSGVTPQHQTTPTESGGALSSSPSVPVGGVGREEALQTNRSSQSLTDQKSQRSTLSAPSEQSSVDPVKVSTEILVASKELASQQLSPAADKIAIQQAQAKIDSLLSTVSNANNLQDFQKVLLLDYLKALVAKSENEAAVNKFAVEINKIAASGDINRLNQFVTQNSALVDSIGGLGFAIGTLREAVRKGDANPTLQVDKLEGLAPIVSAEKAKEIITSGSATEREALSLALTVYSVDMVGSYARRIQEIDPSFRQAVTENAAALLGFDLVDRLRSQAASSDNTSQLIYQRQEDLISSASSPDGASMAQWLAHLKSLTAGYGASRGMIHGLQISPEEREISILALDSRFQALGSELSGIFNGTVNAEELQNAAASVEADVVLSEASKRIGELAESRAFERLQHGESSKFQEISKQIEEEKAKLATLPVLSAPAKAAIQERVQATLSQIEARATQKATDLHARLIRSADEANHAMSGSTDERGLYKALGGGYPDSVYSKEEMDLLRQIYRDRHGEDLDERVKSELSGAELDLGVALLNSDRAAAIAADMKLALDCWWGRAGELERVIDSAGSPEARSEIDAAFMKAYGKDYPRKTKLEEVFRSRLDQVDAETMLGRFNHDKAQAAAVQIAYKIDGFWGADNDGVLGELDKLVDNQILNNGGVLNPEQLQSEMARMRDAYERIHGTGKFESDLSKLNQDVRKYVEALERGNYAEAQCHRIHYATKGAGTNEDQLYKAFELPESAREHLAALQASGMSEDAEALKKAWAELRSATEKEFNAQYQKERGELTKVLRAELGDSDLRHALSLKEGGEVPEVIQLIEAMDGAGTDEDALKKVILGKSKEDIKKLVEDYRVATNGRDLKSDLEGELSGDDEFDVLYVVNNGSPKSAEEQINYVMAREQYERSGGIMSSSITLYLFKKASGFFLGEDVQKALDGDTNLAYTFQVLGSKVFTGKLPQHVRDYNEMKAALDAAQKGQVLDAVAMQRAFSSASSSLDMFRSGKNAAADMIANGATVVVAVAGTAVFVVGTGGAGATVAVPLWGLALGTAGASAGARIIIKSAIKGGSYGIEEFATDTGLSAVDGLATVTGAKLAMAGSSILLEKIGAQALSRGGVFAAKFGRSVEEVSVATLEGLTTAEKAGLSQLAGQAVIERSAAARFIFGSLNGSAVGSGYGVIQGAGYKALDEHTWDHGLSGAVTDIAGAGFIGGGFGIAFGGTLGGATGLWRGWTIRAADAVDDRVAAKILETGRAQSGRGLRVKEFELSPAGKTHLETLQARHGSLTKGNVQDAIDMSVAAERSLASRAERILAKEVASGKIDKEFAARLQQRITDGKLTRFEANELLKRDPNSYVQQLRAPDPIRPNGVRPGAPRQEIPALMEGGPSGARVVATDGVEIIRPVTPSSSSTPRLTNGQVVDAQMVQPAPQARLSSDLAADMNETARQFRSGFDRLKAATSDAERTAIRQELNTIRDRLYAFEDEMKVFYSAGKDSGSVVDDMLRYYTGDDSFLRVVTPEAPSPVVVKTAPKTDGGSPTYEGSMTRQQLDTAMSSPPKGPSGGSSPVGSAPDGYPVNPTGSSGLGARDGGQVHLTPSRSTVLDSADRSRSLVLDHAEVSLGAGASSSGSSTTKVAYGTGTVKTGPTTTTTVETTRVAPPPTTTRTTVQRPQPKVASEEPQLQRKPIVEPQRSGTRPVMEMERPVLDSNLADQLRGIGVTQEVDDLAALFARTDDALVPVTVTRTEASTTTALATAPRRAATRVVLNDTPQLLTRVDPLTARAMVSGQGATSIMDHIAFSTGTALSHQPSPKYGPAASAQAHAKPRPDDDTGSYGAGNNRRIEDEVKKKKVEEENRKIHLEDPARIARSRRLRRDWERKQRGFFEGDDGDGPTLVGAQKGEWIWRSES